MLSALIVLPKGKERALLLKEFRRAKVRVIEWRIGGEKIPFPTQAVDMLVIRNDFSQASGLRQYLDSDKSVRPQIIMLQVKRGMHGLPGYEGETWCLHRPVQACILRPIIRSMIERKRLMARLKRLKRSLETEETHSVDELWFSIFDRLKANSKL